jgi:DNA-binding transcriptional LysR family regulator
MPVDRLDAMSLFAAVVEAGSLSAAARRLDLPLPTVSRRLAELESHLQARLLERGARHLALTDAGAAYLEACRPILRAVEEAERAVAGEYAMPRGELTVAAPVAFGRLHVVPVVAGFLAAHGDVDVRLLLDDRNVNLLEAPVDLAVRIGELPDSSLIARRVGSIVRIVCASPDYLARRGTPRTPEELAAHDCVSFDAVMAGSHWTFAATPGPTRPGRGDPAAPRRIPVRARVAVNTADAAIAAAIAGVGLTRVLSYQAAEALQAGRLVRVLQDAEPDTVPVSIVHGRQGRLPMKSRAFIDFAAPLLQQRLEAMR